MKNNSIIKSQILNCNFKHLKKKKRKLPKKEKKNLLKKKNKLKKDRKQNSISMIINGHNQMEDQNLFHNGSIK